MFNVIKVLIIHRPDCGYCASYLYLVWALRTSMFSTRLRQLFGNTITSVAAVYGSNIMVKVPCVPRGKPGCSTFMRQKVPESDMPRLQHLLKEYVKNIGLEMAFDMGDYKDITKTHAVKGACLVLTYIVYIYILFIYIIQ
jgi:hypothetical protein